VLIARLQEQMLDEQADVAEHAVSHQALVRRRGLQGRDCKRLARTAAFELGRQRRVHALVQAEQAAVKLSSVDLHAGGGRGGGGGEDCRGTGGCGYLVYPLIADKKRGINDPSLPAFAMLSAKLQCRERELSSFRVRGGHATQRQR
jgi:hypothetical protein